MCNKTRKSSPTLSFYRFPVKDESRCSQWLMNSGNQKLILLDLNKEQLSKRLICEKHFRPASFMDLSAVRKKIRHDAVPLKFDEPEEHLSPSHSANDISASPKVLKSNKSQNIRTYASTDSAIDVNEKFSLPKKLNVNYNEESIVDQKK